VFLPVKLGKKRLERNKGRTMKAAILSGIDQPLVFQDAPDPHPGPDEAIVNVAAAALNHRDVWIQKGRYGGLKFPIILGSDGAGVVSAVGEGVDPAWVGQEVIIDPGMGWGDNPRAQSRDFRILGMPDDGTFAQFVKAPVANLHQKPQHLTWEGAAALPLAGVTAYRALFTRAALHDDDRVLINGVGGGVALVALQFAVACGATVYATSSSDEKLARAVELGAAGGANYRQADWAKRLKEQVGGFDLIVDSAGGEGFDTLVDLAVPGGRIVTYGATLGIADRLDLRRVFWKQLDILGSTMGTADDFAAMVRFVESRHITPVVDQVYPLAEAEAAMQRMRAGEQCGKIVLTVGSQ
jgi:zinc-binding alcohol dehydrogenase/oxidoreductase